MHAAISPVPAPTAGRSLWLMLGLMAASTWGAYVALGLRLDLSGTFTPAALCVIYVATTVFYRTIRKEPVIATALETTGQLLLVIFVGVLLSYAAAAVPLPYRDAEFHALDRWLGFERQAYVAFVERHPWLEWALNHAYLSITPQTLLLAGALILAGRVSRLQCFIMAFGLSLAATLMIAAVLPATAAGLFVDLPARGFNAYPAGHYTHVTTLEALRTGALTAIPVTQLEALITFPSFHTVNAILFAWAFWTLPYLRWFAVVLNALMIASTPTAGLHYFVDIIGGFVVAIAAIAIAKRLIKPLREPSHASAIVGELAVNSQPALP